MYNNGLLTYLLRVNYASDVIFLAAQLTRAEGQSARMSKITSDGLTRPGT